MRISYCFLKKWKYLSFFFSYLTSFYQTTQLFNILICEQCCKSNEFFSKTVCFILLKWENAKVYLENRLHMDTKLLTFKKRSKQHFNPLRRGRKKCFIILRSKYVRSNNIQTKN